VTTVAAQRGELPRLIGTYGVTAPAPGATQTISVQYEGQVSALMVSPGETVRTGAPLLRIAPSAAALAAYDQALAAQRLAEAELAHARQLRVQQLATRDQVAQAEKAMTDARTQVDTLKRQGVEASAPPITAPFDGVVNAVAISQGDRVQPNTPLLTLVRSSGIILSAGIEPSDQPEVKAGDAVRMIALADGGTFPGTVETVGAMVDPRTRLVPVRIARIDAHPLIENQDLRAEIIVGQATGWKLPRAAVLTDTKGAYVFQVASGKAVRVDVRILVDTGDTVLVDGPLQADRKVVADGAYQLSPGMAAREEATP
jgi:RND family efflux transporter MFP subunit